MNKPKPFTFNFKGKNSENDFGIIGTSYDFLLSEKRQRRQEIPFRHGAYDYGAHWYNDRILRLDCKWITSMIGSMSRADMREISYWLSQKGKIELAVEPDKYYIGELYDASELVAHYTYAKDRLPDTSDGEFELNFLCEPFAYGEMGEKLIQSGINAVGYEGTAEAPCTIILKNNNAFPITNVQIVVTRRKT